jgi:hypothetical protein
MVSICGNEDMSEYFVSVTHEYSFAVKAETPQAAKAVVDKAWEGGDIYVTAPGNDGFIDSEDTDYALDLELQPSQTLHIDSVETSTGQVVRGQFDDRWMVEVTYNDGKPQLIFVVCELEDIHDRIERGPDWRTIEHIVVTLNRSVPSWRYQPPNVAVP